MPAKRPRGRPRKTTDEAIARLIAFEGLAPEAIAKRLGLSASAVRRGIAAARKIDPHWPHAATLRAAHGLAGPPPSDIVRGQVMGPPVNRTPPSGVDLADPDALEREAARVLLEIATCGGRDDGPRASAAKALLDHAATLHERRGPVTDEDEAADEADARILVALEQAAAPPAALELVPATATGS